MSLTSYRAAPPRGVGCVRECRDRAQVARSALAQAKSDQAQAARSAIPQAKRDRAQVARSALARHEPAQAAGSGSRPAWEIRVSRQTWRRPALPPLGGQYPGRCSVSRPSSEWGRVVPLRSDHQVGREARPAFSPGFSGAGRPRVGDWHEFTSRSCRAPHSGGWQGVGGGSSRSDDGGRRPGGHDQARAPARGLGAGRGDG